MKIVFQKTQEVVLKDFLNNKYNIKLDDKILKACEGSIEKALKVNEKKEEYEETSKIFSNIENYKLLDVINKLDFIRY